MTNFSGMNDLRAVQWRDAFTWDIYFDTTSGVVPDLADPFDKWFPAINVSCGLFNINSFSFSAGAHSYSIPQNITPTDLAITFHDSEDGKCQNWLEEWKNIMFPEPGAVRALDDITATCLLTEIKETNGSNGLRALLVYPEGDFRLDFLQDGAMVFTQNFRIAGQRPADSDRINTLFNQRDTLQL